MPRLRFWRRTSLPVRTLLLCAIASAGCSAARPCPEPVRVEVARECLKEPPPAILPVPVEGPETGCPAVFAGCLLPGPGARLAGSLEASRRWQDEAWIRCGPRDAGSLDAGS